jgi:hypothetical protein
MSILSIESFSVENKIATNEGIKNAFQITDNSRMMSRQKC